MPSKRRSQIFIAATALGAVLATPAFAQAGEGDVGDIVVTARRVEERLQDVPISITVYSQEGLANRNIVTPTDLATYTPSLTVNQRYGPEKASFVIRGFTQEQNTSPSVGTYFADVVAPRAQTGTTSGNGSGAGSLFDLQNVQVLKGPQGTLFGRNTTGGAVLLVPQKPTDKLEGYVEGSIGDYGMWRGQGVLNIPLAETFKVRLGVDRNHRDGYMRNRSGIGPKAYNDVDYFAARLSVVADLTPDLENYTIASYNHSFSNGYGARIAFCLRDGITRLGNTNYALSDSLRRTAPNACAQVARAQARGDGPLDVDIGNPDPFLNMRQWQVINTTTWKASDTLTIKNIVSYAEYRESASFSLNGDNFTVLPTDFVSAALPDIPANSPLVGQRFYQTQLRPGFSGDNAAQSTFTEELQLQGNSADNSLVWQLGAYLEVSNPLGLSTGYTPSFATCSGLESPLTQCTTPYTGVGNVAESVQTTKWNNKGFYAQATYNLTEQLSVTGGIRYTIDRIDALGASRRPRLATTGSVVAPAPNCSDSRIPGTATSYLQCQRFFSQKSKRPTWLINVDYKPIPDVMVYAKWARGYRQGGIAIGNTGLETWGPEKVEAYEIGAKTTFGAGSMRGYFNVAAFYNDFTDQQLVVTLRPRPFVNGQPNTLTGGAGVINAGKSKIQGIELDTSVTLFDDLRLDLGYTYLDTKLKSIVIPDLSATPFDLATPTALVGEPLALSPKHRLTASATYTLPLPEEIGKVSFGVTYTYTAEQYASRASDNILWNTAGCPIPAGSTTPTCSVTTASVIGYNPGLMPATNLVNLNVNWNGVLGQPIDAAFFVTNLTNEIYPVSLGSSLNTGGYESLIYGAPRMYGFRLRYSFGS